MCLNHTGPNAHNCESDEIRDLQMTHSMNVTRSREETAQLEARIMRQSQDYDRNTRELQHIHEARMAQAEQTLISGANDAANAQNALR